MAEQAQDAGADAERLFLDASIAVWEEIDRMSSRPEGYTGLDPRTDLRKVERAAWERYRDLRWPSRAGVVRPRLLDLFCGAGGAAEGYARAGFTVIGVDHIDQPSYHFPYEKDDALNFLSRCDVTKAFDAIHASPPCQHYAPVTSWRGKQANHLDLLAPTVEALRATGLPWVVENVPYAPMAPDFVLCGSMFGLPLRRHRWFLTSWSGFELVPRCDHRADDLSFDHGGKQPESVYRDAMGCGWMTVKESRNAIPPAYTEWIGARLMKQVGTRAA